MNGPGIAVSSPHTDIPKTGWYMTEYENTVTKKTERHLIQVIYADGKLWWKYPHTASCNEVTPDSPSKVICKVDL